MEFVIRKAGYEDIPGIMAVMKDAQKAIEHPEWFCSDREEYMKKHIETYGFTIVAEPVSGSSLAGFSYKISGAFGGKSGTFTELFRRRIAENCPYGYGGCASILAGKRPSVPYAP